MMKLLMAAAIGAATTATSAQVLIGNFGAGVGVGTAFGNASTTVFKAAGFQMPRQDWEVNRVTLSMTFVEAEVTVSIWSGANVPTTRLMTLDSPAQVGSGDFTFTPPSQLILSADETYWVYVEPGPVLGANSTWDGTSPSTLPTGEATHVGYIFNGNPSSFNNRYQIVGSPIVACYPDCTGDSVLDIFDFLCFQDAFVVMDPYADCTGEGTFDIFDFLCFQDAFVVGCP